MSYACRSCYLYSAPCFLHLPFFRHYYSICTVHPGHRPHFPLVLKTTWNTISLVKSFTGMPHRAASFPSNSIVPRALPQGPWLTEVFTCLKMYQTKNRSHFLSMLDLFFLLSFHVPGWRIKHFCLISPADREEQRKNITTLWWWRKKNPKENTF